MMMMKHISEGNPEKATLSRFSYFLSVYNHKTLEK